jgi:hypothetical protein
MSKQEIIKAINARVTSLGASFSAWRIGITHDPVERKNNWSETEKENVGCWTQWQADSLSDAQDIESYFINEKKMKGGTGGDMDSRKTTYVYIF